MFDSDDRPSLSWFGTVTYQGKSAAVPGGRSWAKSVSVDPERLGGMEAQLEPSRRQSGTAAVRPARPQRRFGPSCSARPIMLHYIDLTRKPRPASSECPASAVCVYRRSFACCFQALARSSACFLSQKKTIKLMNLFLSCL